MSARVWSNLQQKPKGKNGWQLVGRGTSDAPKKDDNRTVRSLTYKEVSEMSAADAEWHTRNNPDHWKKAFDEEERRRKSKIHVAKSRVELFYEGHSTEEEDQETFQTSRRFATSTPSFPRTKEAVVLMRDFMKLNLLDPTRMESYQQAYKTLVDEEKIEPLQYQSADAFYHEHRELHPAQKPPLIQAKEAKAEATKSAFQRAEAATARAGSTAFTDFPPEQHGVPPLNDIEKVSLRNLVKNIAADELAEKCRNDASFKKALDSLKS